MRRDGRGRCWVLSLRVLISQRLGREQDLSQIEVRGSTVNRVISSVSVAQTGHAHRAM